MRWWWLQHTSNERTGRGIEGGLGRVLPLTSCLTLSKSPAFGDLIILCINWSGWNRWSLRSLPNLIFLGSKFSQGTQCSSRRIGDWTLHGGLYTGGRVLSVVFLTGSLGSLRALGDGPGTALETKGEVIWAGRAFLVDFLLILFYSGPGIFKKNFFLNLFLYWNCISDSLNWRGSFA